MYPNNTTIHNLISAGFSQFNKIKKSLYHLQQVLYIVKWLKNYLGLNNLHFKK